MKLTCPFHLCPRTGPDLLSLIAVQYDALSHHAFLRLNLKKIFDDQCSFVTNYVTIIAGFEK